MDTDNIMEIQQIKSLLSHDKYLLQLFNQILKIVNKKIDINDSSESESDSDDDYDILTPLPP